MHSHILHVKYQTHARQLVRVLLPEGAGVRTLSVTLGVALVQFLLDVLGLRVVVDVLIVAVGVALRKRNIFTVGVLAERRRGAEVRRLQMKRREA